MNTRKHSKTLEKSRSWSQVNAVLIALGFSLTCAQAQTTAPNSSLNQTQTQAALDVAVAGIVANKSVVDINGIQAIYDDAKTTFTSRDKDLGVINKRITLLTATPGAEAELVIAQSQQKVIENELLALTGTITTLNKFVNETAGAPLGETKQLTLTKGDGTFTDTDKKNTTSLAEVTKLVTAYKGGISSQPSLETTIDSLKDSPVGVRSGYQASETQKVTDAKEKYVANKTLANLKAYADSVQAQLASYAALDEAKRTQLVTTTLNGSWERTAINALDGKITTAIATEVTDRNTAIGTAIATEVTARNGAIGTAIATEVTARNGAIGTAIATEVTARNGAIGTAINAEAGAREAADLAEADAREAADLTEVTARNGAIGTAIATEVTARNGAIGTAIATEVTARGNADTALGVRITGETTDRVAAINAERAAQIAAINAEADRATLAERAITLKLDTHTLQLANHETRLISAESKLANHETRLISAESNIQRLNRGIAMTAALVTPTIESGNNNAVSFTAAGYEGDTGFSLGYARRISGGLSAHLAVASSDQFEETVVRGGVNFSW